jgi:hypothetical protein
MVVKHNDWQPLHSISSTDDIVLIVRRMITGRCGLIDLITRTGILEYCGSRDEQEVLEELFGRKPTLMLCFGALG